MVALLSAFTANALGALIAGGAAAGMGALRRALAITLSLVPFGVAAVVPPDDLLLRCWVWVGSCFLLVRMFDVLAEAHRPWTFRLVLMLCVLDARTFRAVPPGLDLPLLTRTVGYGLLAGMGALAVIGTEGAAQWPGAALCLYAGMEAVDSLYRLPFRFAGLSLRPMQDVPIRSRSLGEFWGRRWNREVGGLLFRWCFRPLARRGFPRAGQVWAFACSGLLHSVGVYAAVGAAGAALVQVFFFTQGGLLLAERALGVPRWPPLAGHAWVIGTLLLTGPLFLEPALAVVGMR